MYGVRQWMPEDIDMRPLPKRSFDRGQVLELLCKHVGLAKAYQWVHLRELR